MRLSSFTRTSTELRRPVPPRAPRRREVTEGCSGAVDDERAASLSSSVPPPPTADARLFASVPPDVRSTSLDRSAASSSHLVPERLPPTPSPRAHARGTPDGFPPGAMRRARHRFHDPTRAAASSRSNRDRPAPSRGSASVRRVHHHRRRPLGHREAEGGASGRYVLDRSRPPVTRASSPRPRATLPHDRQRPTPTPPCASARRRTIDLVERLEHLLGAVGRDRRDRCLSAMRSS